MHIWAEGGTVGIHSLYLEAFSGQSPFKITFTFKAMEIDLERLRPFLLVNWQAGNKNSGLPLLNSMRKNNPDDGGDGDG